MLRQYWIHPDKANLPKSYLEGKERSKFLVEIIKSYITDFDVKILEIGCNVGRNLNYLFQAGYKNLSGIEINGEAIKLMKKHYFEMAKNTQIYVGSVEDLIQNFGDKEFDVVFTMAVFQHIHSDSTFIFPHVARITKHLLVTIEDEKGVSWRHFPRNYKKVFESYGLTEVQALNCKNIKGLDSNFVARIFQKN